MRLDLDIDEKHFHVFHLLLLLLAWANTCYILVIFLRNLLPVLVTTLLVISGTVLTLAMVIITIIISIRWIKHHNLGWWFFIGLIILFILSWGLESTVRGIFLRQQMYQNQEMY